MNDVVSIKGGKEGLRIQLDEAADWPVVLGTLRAHFDQSSSFFAGARLLIDIGERPLSEEQLAEMLGLMQQHGIRPQTLATTDRASRQAARTAGLTTCLPAAPLPLQPTAAASDEAALVVRTVRSGQVVRHPGHITLIGDVNAGAQVIAGGSVVVWGRLRGMVHAGAFGNDGALICALELRPTQLRIAQLIARTPEGASPHPPLPEVACVDAGNIIVEAWELYRR